MKQANLYVLLLIQACILTELLATTSFSHPNQHNALRQTEDSPQDDKTLIKDASSSSDPNNHFWDTANTLLSAFSRIFSLFRYKEHNESQIPRRFIPLSENEKQRLLAEDFDSGSNVISYSQYDTNGRDLRSAVQLPMQRNVRDSHTTAQISKDDVLREDGASTLRRVKRMTSKFIGLAVGASTDHTLQNSVKKTVNQIEADIWSLQPQITKPFEVSGQKHSTTLGVFMSSFVTNFHGTETQSSLRQTYSIPDANSLSTLLILQCLVEANVYGSAPHPSVSNMSTSVEALEEFHTHLYASESAIITLWPEEMLKDHQGWANIPENILKTKVQHETTFGQLEALVKSCSCEPAKSGLQAISSNKLCKDYFSTPVADLLNDEATPPEFITSFSNLALGALLTAKIDKNGDGDVYKTESTLWLAANGDLEKLVSKLKEMVIIFPAKKKPVTVVPTTPKSQENAEIKNTTTKPEQPENSKDIEVIHEKSNVTSGGGQENVGEDKGDTGSTADVESNEKNEDGKVESNDSNKNENNENDDDSNNGAENEKGDEINNTTITDIITSNITIDNDNDTESYENGENASISQNSEAQNGKSNETDSQNGSETEENPNTHNISRRETGPNDTESILDIDTDNETNADLHIDASADNSTIVESINITQVPPVSTSPTTVSTSSTTVSNSSTATETPTAIETHTNVTDNSNAIALNSNSVNATAASTTATTRTTGATTTLTTTTAPPIPSAKPPETTTTTTIKPNTTSVSTTTPTTTTTTTTPLTTTTPTTTTTTTTPTTTTTTTTTITTTTTHHKPEDREHVNQIIDSMSYFGLRPYLDEVIPDAEEDVILIPSLISDDGDVENTNSDDGNIWHNSQVFHEYNHVDLTTTATVLHSLVVSSMTGLVNIDNDPLLQKIMTSSLRLLTWYMTHPNELVTMVTLSAFPSRFQLYWATSRVAFQLNSKQARNSGMFKFAEEDISLFVKALREQMTFSILQSITDGGLGQDGKTRVYIDDFIGRNDLDSSGKQKVSGDDRLFTSALATNALISTWSVQQDDGFLRFADGVTDAVRIAVNSLANYITGEVTNKDTSNTNAYMSERIKSCETFPAWYPSNIITTKNGEEVATVKEPGVGFRFGVRGYIPKEDYQSMLDKPPFGHKTRGDNSNELNSPSSLFRFWSSPAYTKAVSLLAIAQASNLRVDGNR